jgi:hypothetical protein
MPLGKQNRRRKLAEVTMLMGCPSSSSAQQTSEKHASDNNKENGDHREQLTATKRRRIDNAQHCSPTTVVTCVKSKTPSSTSTTSSPSNLEMLPPELFCNILSFIGPTSNSLVALAQLNHSFRGTMKAVGKAMLPRVKVLFRVLLQQKSPRESSTCLFVRHARACSNVLDKLTQLRSLLSKPHCTMNNDEVQDSLSLALELLEMAPSMSLSLERQILASCGKCGGKAFKYSKSRLAQCLAVPVEDDATPSDLIRQNRMLVRTEFRLDMARLVMQTVVFRNWKLFKRGDLGGGIPMIPKQEQLAPVVKDVPPMGYFWK